MKKAKEQPGGQHPAAATKGYTGAAVNAVTQQGNAGFNADTRNVAFGKAETGNIGHSGAARKSSTGKSGSGK